MGRGPDCVIVRKRRVNSSIDEVSQLVVDDLIKSRTATRAWVAHAQMPCVQRDLDCSVRGKERMVNAGLQPELDFERDFVWSFDAAEKGVVVATLMKRSVNLVTYLVDQIVQRLRNNLDLNNTPSQTRHHSCQPLASGRPGPVRRQRATLCVDNGIAPEAFARLYSAQPSPPPEGPRSPIGRTALRSTGFPVRGATPSLPALKPRIELVQYGREQPSGAPAVSARWSDERGTVTPRPPWRRRRRGGGSGLLARQRR